MDDEDDADLDDNTATPRARSAKRRPLSSAEKSAPVVGHDRLPTLDHLAGRTDEDPMSTGARTATRNASPGPSTRPDEGKTPARSSSPNKRSATTSSHTTRAAGKGKAAESAIEEMNRILRENKQQSIIEKQQTKRMKYELKLKNQEKGTKVDLIERQMSNLQVRIESIHLMTSNNTSMLASINAHLGVISRQGDGIIPSTPFRASASPVHQWASSSSSSSSSHAPTFSHPTTSAQGTTSFYPMASSYQPTESNYSNDDV
ncbi:hypothetical protein A4X13_0g9626 [Tilletia indica]|uniref:Uncharacterized protein n=1 Tax=Tilletia indica TaxID=43049 RepID=A0A8T8S8K9_9BASI|nr:hypothetical protein A4X13_0g9626 [Tilletia indica]